MKTIFSFLLLTLIVIKLSSCVQTPTGHRNSNNTKTSADRNPAPASNDSLHRDAITLKESSNGDDIQANGDSSLYPIQKNFRRINSITNWTSIDKKDLWETTEGGEAKFYFQNKKLEKIATRTFGETFQQLTEYYLLNGQLSFVFEKSLHYNRPMYYDSGFMKENKDTAVYDFNKSTIAETRSYFENGKLLRQISNQNSGSALSPSEEQKRLNEDFGKLTALVRK